MANSVQRKAPYGALFRTVVMRAGRLACGGAGPQALVVLTGLAGCGRQEPVAAEPAPVPPVASCVLFDGDSNLDDLRALAVLWPHTRDAAVITTGGILSPQAGAVTMAQFLGGARQAVVIQGRTRPATSAAPHGPGWQKPEPMPNASRRYLRP